MSVFAELLRIELVDQPVPVGVTGWLVSPGDDLAHKRWVPLGHPAEDEERGLHSSFIKEVEEAASVGLDAARVGTPVRPVYDVGKGLNMIVVLHIHRNDVVDTHWR